MVGGESGESGASVPASRPASEPASKPASIPPSMQVFTEQLPAPHARHVPQGVPSVERSQLPFPDGFPSIVGEPALHEPDEHVETTHVRIERPLVEQIGSDHVHE